MIECWKFTREIRSNLEETYADEESTINNAIWHKLVRLELR